jgi:hypothetical protein
LVEYFFDYSVFFFFENTGCFLCFKVKCGIWVKIKRGTKNQAAGIFPLGMVAQFIEFSWNL